jgi:hypothetical protein
LEGLARSKAFRQVPTIAPHHGQHCPGLGGVPLFGFGIWGNEWRKVHGPLGFLVFREFQGGKRFRLSSLGEIFIRGPFKIAAIQNGVGSVFGGEKEIIDAASAEFPDHDHHHDLE